MTPQEQLDAIKVGKNYPSFVRIKEKDDEGKDMEVTFTLNSFFVGMYCEIRCNGDLAGQHGDHDNKRFVRNLKKDVAKAIERGAVVEIGSLRDCKLNP